MRHVRTLVAVVASAAVMGVAIWKAGVLRASAGGADASEHETTRVIAVGQSAFKGIRLIPQPKGVPASERAEQLRSLATLEGEVPKAVEMVESLFLAFSEFEQLRYGGGSAAEYARWREVKGYRRRALDVMKKEWGVDQDFKMWFGEDLPAALDATDVFARLYDYGLKAGGGSSNPVAVAGEPSGIVVRFGRFANAKGDRPMLEGSLGTAVWHGRNAGTMRNWWEPVRSADTVAKGSGGLLRAELGMVTKNEGGRLCPRIYSYYWDPQSRTWMLEHINDNNADLSHCTPLEY